METKKQITIADAVFYCIVFATLSALGTIVADVDLPDIPIWWKITCGVGSAAAVMLILFMIVMLGIKAVTTTIRFLNQKGE